MSDVYVGWSASDSLFYWQNRTVHHRTQKKPQLRDIHLYTRWFKTLVKYLWWLLGR
jgi:hypothetical protein